MPLTGTGPALGAAMRAAFESLDPVLFQTNPTAARTAMFSALGTAIVNHIIAKTVVTSTVAVASVSGVTTGGGTSGPGTGTATGTVS
jgi:hypothetical protein